MINALPQLKGVSTISNTCAYNLLAWKWIDQKYDVKCKYLHVLCVIFAYTVFLLCGQMYSAKEQCIMGHRKSSTDVFMLNI